MYRSLSHVDDLSLKVSGCINDVGWMRTNRLQLNPEKTVLLWCLFSQHQHQLPTATLAIDSTTVAPVSSVRHVDIFIDSYLVMCTRVSNGVALFRCIASSYFSANFFQSFVAALVLSQLECGIWLVFQPAFSVNSCRYRMQWHGSYIGSVVSST